MSGMIDIVMTKSISRFSRNLVDTLQYVRMLKERGVTIIFEKENINTLDVKGEVHLVAMQGVFTFIGNLQSKTVPGLNLSTKWFIM